MSDTKISGLSGVSTLLGTDEFVLARSGTTKKVNLTDYLLSVFAWTSYTPALSAATTPPNLGTSPTTTGRYLHVGDLVVFNATIQFGTGGSVSAGSGNYSVTLPVNIDAAHTGPVGYLQIADNSASTRRSGMLLQKDSDEVFLLCDGTTAFVSNSVPWTWAAQDSIYLFGAYQAA